MDTLNYNVNLNHFAYINGKTSDGALFWAVTVVNCPQDMPGVRLAIGSNASSIWWVNGKEVAGIYGDILTVIDDGDFPAVDPQERSEHHSRRDYQWQRRQRLLRAISGQGRTNR